jgi:SAM-dependent methyltransferase
MTSGNTSLENAAATRENGAPAACPLCGGGNVFMAKRLNTAPIVRYWVALGYDVEKAFPQLRGEVSKWQCVDCDLRFFTPQAIGCPDLYRAVGRSPAYYAGEKWEFTHVLRRFALRPRSGLLLEIGCGPGNFLERAAPYFDRVVGVDFNEGAVHEAKSRGLNVRACNVSELAETFDTIAAFQVIEHVSQPGVLLRQLAKLLRPGGELIVAVPNEDSLLSAMEQNILNLPPHHASCWSRAALESAARLSSLIVEDYVHEPLGLDLYLGALHERLDRYLGGGNVVMRPWLWLIRRAAIARALISYDLVRRAEYGHTHIAFFRRSTG